jgi:predicted nucleic acid-binding protein
MLTSIKLLVYNISKKYTERGLNKIIVLDASSLILLGKCGLVETLSQTFRMVIPNMVFNEVVNEEALKNYPEAKIISDLVDGKKIEVISIKRQKLKFPITLGEGEIEAIILTQQIENAIWVTDDGRAIKACRYLKVPFIISPKVVVNLYQLGKIDFTVAKTSIDKLRIIGRYSPEIIAEALLRLEEVRNVKTNNR